MEILARPDGTEFEKRFGPNFWVDEAIWGHRLHDEQTPWLIFLEFLTVFLAEYRDGEVFHEEQLNSLSYRPQLQLRLRNLVFNNPYMVTILSSIHSDSEAWLSWLEKMEKMSGGIEKPDFAYLRDHFEHFEDFASILRFLQGSSIEGGSNKRWSSKFVFPFGPNALYEDLNVKLNGGISNDRRFFARTGELLYLMLSRSNIKDELRDQLISCFIHNASPYDRIARILQGEPQLAKKERGGAYLPCSTHWIFDQIAADWLAILKLPIPRYDTIPHIVTMTGLNLILYQLDRARELLGFSKINFVCEIISPKKSIVRDLSADSYQQNNILPQRAIEFFIRRITDTDAWKDALISDDTKSSATDLLKKEFIWSDCEDDKIPELPQEILEVLLKDAIRRHKQHFGKIHMSWARAIGLASRRSSRRVRYAPTDRLLRTLVVACVNERIEFKDFLALIYKRYGLIIGDIQAQSFIDNGTADQEDFSDNADRLEQRLASLGLLKRLSDSCAYVENPFR